MKILLHFVHELKLLGLSGSIYRISYELKNRLNIKEYTGPVDAQSSEKWKNNLHKKICTATGPPFLIDTSIDYSFHLASIKNINPPLIINNAEKAANGYIRTFSKELRNYGKPKQWHYNPVRKTLWPQVHYSRVMKHEAACGDIKLVWELNRFSYVYDYVRAYYLTKDSYWCKVFCKELKEWQENNVYRLGVNWNSGQELAIRVLVWLFAFFAFRDDALFREEDFQRIVSLMYLHGEHLEANIDYARKAVHNNHLIGEALGLYVIGIYFPGFKQSEKWKRLGRNILENDCLKQFYEDGGYCQNSHNYHRLALHYYLWACRIAELNNEPMGPRVMKVMENSLELLVSNMNNINGMLPNYGANDGALLNPWTACDYTDYRPLINALSYLLRKSRVFEPGPWDEELLWLFGPDALKSPVIKPAIVSKSFPAAGLHVLRHSAGNFLVFRCGSVKDRFGQADQLHVDLWWQGLNIAQDPGSYLYNDELKYHYHFVGTSSHNTITVDNANQMLLYRRFKFLYWTKAKLLSFVKAGEMQETTGEHYGYCSLAEPLVHRRKVISVNKDIFVVMDRVFGHKELKSEHELRLHWLLAKYNFNHLQLTSWQGVNLFTPEGNYYVLTMALNDDDNRLLEAKMKTAAGAENDPAGWISRYYSYKEKALSLSLSVASKNAKFITIFAPEERVPEITINNMKLNVADKSISLNF